MKSLVKIAISILLTLVTVGLSPSPVFANQPNHQYNESVSREAGRIISSSSSGSSPLYYLALGDSLAYGYQPGLNSGNGYVQDTFAAESKIYPGLELENLGCSGETTTTFINGGKCNFTDGNQLSQADAFIAAHVGEIAFVSIDIGANDVDNCLTPAGPSVTCAQAGVTAVKNNLETIVINLRNALGANVPIFGLNYYDPFLSLWLAGSKGQQYASVSLFLLAILNGTMDNIYGSENIALVDVASAFFSNVTSQYRTYNNRKVPLDVYNICQWTWMCSQTNIHANNAGYQVIADTLEATISGYYSHQSTGLWVTDSQGILYRYGKAPFLGDLTSITLNKPIVAIASTPDHGGYWMVGSDGGVFAFGDARFYGSGANLSLSGTIVAIASTPNGQGYWLASSEGGVYSFGDAGFFGARAGNYSAGPIVAIASTPDGQGYWLATSDGAVYSFGDAGWLGSIPGKVNGLVTSIASTPDGNGYWLVSSSGQIYGLGEAQVAALSGQITTASSPVSIVPSPYQGAYWLVDSSSNIMGFGGAPNMAEQYGEKVPSATAGAFY